MFFLYHPATNSKIHGAILLRNSPYQCYSLAQSFANVVHLWTDVNEITVDIESAGHVSVYQCALTAVRTIPLLKFVCSQIRTADFKSIQSAREEYRFAMDPTFPCSDTIAQFNLPMRPAIRMYHFHSLVRSSVKLYC